MPNRRGAPRKWLITLVKAALSLAAIVYIFFHVDRSLLLADWNKLHAVSIVVALCLVGVQTSVIAPIRLKLIFRGFGLRLPLAAVWQVAISGSFVEQVALGFLGGDATRLLLLHHKNIAMKLAVPTVIFDRIVGLSALALLAVAGLPNVFVLLEGADRQRLVAFGGCALLLAAAVALVARRFKPIVRQFGEYISLIRTAVDNGVFHIHVWPVPFLALFTHVISVAIFAVIGYDLHLPLSFWQWFFVVPTALLLAAIPITAGGWGLREAILIAALAPFGVPAETAIIPSVIFGVSCLLATLPGSIALLAGRAAVSPPGGNRAATESKAGVAAEGLVARTHGAAGMLGDTACD